MLQRLPVLLRENGWHARVSIRKAEVIDVRAPHQSPLGLALDIGTSKIAGYLWIWKAAHLSAWKES